MNLVGVETSGPVIGMALRTARGTWQRTQRIQRGADTLLAPWLLELCEEAGLTTAELDGVVACHGPGAFTGLRVGLAFAAGVALALGKPLVPVSSLQARARRFQRVLVMMDARKSRVYAQCFVNGVAVGEVADLPPAEVLQQLPPDCLVTGEGAGVYQYLVASVGGRLAEVWDDPAVDVLCESGEEGLGKGLGVDPADV